MEPQDARKTVPKFASFKRRAPTKEETSKLPLNCGNDLGKKDPHQDLGSNYPHTSTTGNNSRQYMVDVRGDLDNVRYGSLYNYSIPSYRRFGRGSVIGSPRWMKINPSTDEKRAIELRSSTQGTTQRALSATTVSQRQHRELKIQPIIRRSSPKESEEEFIALAPTSLEISEWSANGVILDDVTASEDPPSGFREHEVSSSNYRNDENVALTPNSLHATEDRTSHRNTNHLIADLRRRAQDHPTNGQLWIELVQAYRTHDLGIGILNDDEAEPRGNAEFRMSVVEEALKSVRNYSEQERLLEIYMNEADTIWESGKMLTEWQNLVAKHDKMFSLRIAYINFLQMNSTIFRFGQIRDAAISALAALAQAGLPSEGHNKLTFGHRCRLVCLLTTCARDSGYRELASAIWQANLEFNLGQRSTDTALSHNHQAKPSLLDFQEFWESEDHRIGEDEYRDSLLNPNVRQQEMTLATWPESEATLSKGADFSARTNDERYEKDPYSVVLVSEVIPFLINAETAAEKFLLIESFMQFARLPAANLENDEDSSHYHILLQSSETVSKAILSNEQSAQCLSGLNGRFQLDDNILFAVSDEWYSAFPPNVLDEEKPEWHRKALLEIIDNGFYSESLMEYYLALELHQNPTGARKTAKRFLKRHPNSLVLYNAYINIELRLGNSDRAESVLSKVLDANSGSEDSLFLIRTWIWSKIGKRQYQIAGSRLLALVDGQRKSSQVDGGSFETALELRKTLEHRIRRSIAARDFKHAILHMEFNVLLDYLVISQDIQSSLTNFSELESTFFHAEMPTRWKELFHQFRARLLYTHYRRGAECSSVNACQILSESATVFPDNAIFSNVIECLDPETGANDRFRAIILQIRGASDEHQLATAPSIAEAPYAHVRNVQRELKRYSGGRSSLHAVRKAFERSVTSRTGSHFPPLWKSYVAFEIDNAAYGQAKSVFYRALHACPWYKDLYLVAFFSLRGIMDTAELRSIYDLMEDREIRIHIPLDEVFERSE